MWKRRIDGKDLVFHLSGINNENFLMRDEQTGSWWQQVSGKAILGPLKGRQLEHVFHDEVTFATWRREHPGSKVLRPAAAAQQNYASADWEAEIAKLPVVTPRRASEPLEDRDLVVGVALPGGASRAYLLSDLAKQGVVNDRLDGIPLLVLPFEAGKSVRVFRREVDGQVLEFFALKGDEGEGIMDAATGSRWDVTGTAIQGALAGKRLDPVDVLPDYWFDWKTYHPDGDVYRAGR